MAHVFMRIWRQSRFCLIALLLAFAWLARAESNADLAAYRKQRHAAANRQRRVIFNNDGNEPVYFCTNATAQDLLQSRTAPLADSQVDSIFYCTWSSGFGLFTHHTKVGQLFTMREAMFAKNRTQEFFDKGIDPLHVMIDWSHTHKKEIFWSMRMNDTHDGHNAAYCPVMFRTNKLKADHPEFLIGEKGKRQACGAWSAVNYGLPEIRELAFQFCEEVCRNYDVDGIELDFFRHPFFFKKSAANEPCGAEELEQMTGLIRRICAMTEEVGLKRKRPILVAVRVPDSVEYCRIIGLDLERWLAEGLVDLMTVGGYINLNPLEYSVALGHKYGVKVYPSLDETRLRDPVAAESRRSLQAYRGRALNAWDAGADGIYLFNFFDPHSPLWRELGDRKGLQQLDHDYFVSILGVGKVDVPHEKFLNLPTLNPNNPLVVRAGQSNTVTFRIGEAFASVDPSAILHLRFKDPIDTNSVIVQLNGARLLPGTLTNQSSQYRVARNLKKGINKLELHSTKRTVSLMDLRVEVRKGAGDSKR